MKIDKFFYEFFRQFRSAFFALLGEDRRKARKYKFTAVEVQEQAFRFDGVFIPETKKDDIYFAEAQFGKKREVADMLINLLSSKLPQLSREEIQKMFQPVLTDVRKTRFYQDVAEEVGQKKAQKIAKALLKEKMSLARIAKVTGLPTKEIQALNKASAARWN